MEKISINADELSDFAHMYRKTMHQFINEYANTIFEVYYPQSGITVTYNEPGGMRYDLLPQQAPDSQEHEVHGNCRGYGQSNDYDD